MSTFKSKPEPHGFLRWVFCSPGAAILQLEYLFPGSVRGSFGTARRRKVVLLQFLYTLSFYAFVAVVVWVIVMKPKLAWLILMFIAAPFIMLEQALKPLWDRITG